MKAIMALSQIICLTFAYFMCISGMTIDELIQSAYNVSGIQHTENENTDSVVVELDMMQTQKEIERRCSASSFGHRVKRVAVRDEDKRWTNKTLVYFIPNSFDRTETEIIIGAMNVWANHTCLQFKERSNRQKNYTIFSDGFGCYANVGMIGFKQKINLGPGCVKKQVVIHEIGHAIGLHHTHSRPDRDDYVTLNMSNVNSDDWKNFCKATVDEVTDFGINYDYHSIMHYGKRFFSSNNQPTLIPENTTFLDIIGKYSEPSFGDIKMVNLMYNCHEHCPPTTCPDVGFLSEDCKCMCPGNPATGPPIISCQAQVPVDNSINDPTCTDSTETPRSAVSKSERYDDCKSFVEAERCRCARTDVQQTCCETCADIDISDCDCQDLYNVRLRPYTVVFLKVVKDGKLEEEHPHNCDEIKAKFPQYCGGLRNHRVYEAMCCKSCKGVDYTRVDDLDWRTTVSLNSDPSVTCENCNCHEIVDKSQDLMQQVCKADIEGVLTPARDGVAMTARTACCHQCGRLGFKKPKGYQRTFKIEYSSFHYFAPPKQVKPYR